MQRVRFTSFLRRVWPVLAVLLLTMAPARSGETSYKYLPLDWEWSKEEIKELKTLAESVRKNEEDGSYTLETANWRIRTWHTPLFTAQAGKYMEIFSEVFFKAFMLKGERGFTDFKPELRIHPSRGKYLAVPGMVAWSVGLCTCRWETVNGRIVPEIILHTYFDPGAKDAKNAKGGKDKGPKEPVFGTRVPLGTIQHEATHCLLQCIYGPIPIPTWLNEGAASYYQGWLLRMKISDDGESPKDVEARTKRRTYSPRPRYLRYLTKERKLGLPHLDELLSANSHEQFYCDDGGPMTNVNYCLAESFIDFLMNSRNRRPLMIKILERVRDQKGVSSPEQPFVTDEEMLEYEKEWLQFLATRWGVRYPVDQIKERVRELKERAAAAGKDDGK